MSSTSYDCKGGSARLFRHVSPSCKSSVPRSCSCRQAIWLPSPSATPITICVGLRKGLLPLGWSITGCSSGHGVELVIGIDDSPRQCGSSSSSDQEPLLVLGPLATGLPPSLQCLVHDFDVLMPSSPSWTMRWQHRYQYGCTHSNTLMNYQSHLWMRRRRLQVLTGFSSRQICYGGGRIRQGAGGCTLSHQACW